MKNQLLRKFTFLLLMFSATYSWSQTIFSENMGSTTGNTAISAHTFQNSALLNYSNGGQTGSADVRTTSTSNGYSGSSGSGNVYFTSTSGAYGFSIEGIDASDYSLLSLQFGYKKESSSQFASFSVDYWDGSQWITLANTASTLFNEAANASAVWYLSKAITLPVNAQIDVLKIRFVKTGSVAIRIDDVKLTGSTNHVVSTEAVSNVTTNSATFTGDVTGTSGSTITANGTVYSNLAINANPVLGGVGVTTLNTASPNSGNGSFTNNTGSVLSPNVAYAYNAFATKSGSVTGYGVVRNFYTLAVIPSAPTVNTLNESSLSVVLSSDANSTITTYAIFETNTSNYVQVNGSLGTNAVYQTAVEWGTKAVIGLTPSMTYSFGVIAKNGEGITTAIGQTSSGTTAAHSTSSDIHLNSGSSTNSNTNIDYNIYQGTTLTNTGSGSNGSLGVLGFYLRDGGAAMNDADNLPTELTGVSIHIVNPDNVKAIRLFVGTSPRGEAVLVNGASVVNLTGLTNIIAPDNDQLAINLRVTFNSTVTDNQQVAFIVNGVTAKDTGSQFGTYNGGGVNSLTTGDINRIEVTATKLDFIQQPPESFEEKINMMPSPSVEAIDDNGNRDLDFSNGITIVSTGTLVVSPQIATPYAGLAVFDMINHDLSGSGLFLTASSNGLSSIQSTVFNIFIVPKFDSVEAYLENSVISELPTTSINGVVGTWSPTINNVETTIYTFTPNPGQNATNATLTIEVAAAPFGDGNVEMAVFNETCIIQGISVTGTSATRRNYINPNPSSNNFCGPATIHSPCASSLTSNITLTFSTPITSVRIPFYVMDNFLYGNGGHIQDKMKITVNSPGVLTFTNLCALTLNMYNQLVCNFPLLPPEVTNSGHCGVTVNSTIPFTTLIIDDQGPTAFSTHPCDLSNIVTCLAGINAPNLSATTINSICPNTNANLTTLTANNQPLNSTLTWHTTTPANGSSLVSSPNAVVAGTYYAAFYDAVRNCYSPTSTAVTVTVNACSSDLIVTKTVNNSNPGVNSNVIFTITASNNGPSPATGVTVTDVLPSGYNLVSSTPSTGTWTNPNWIIGNLTNGGTASLTIVAQVGCGNYSNTAVISGNQIDSNLLNNSSTSTVNPLIVVNAVDDDFSADLICPGGQTTSVFNNDTFTCNTVNSSSVQITLTNNGGINGATIDSNGLITVPITTLPGTYFLDYMICETANTSNCDTGNVKIIVNSIINAQNDDFSTDPIFTCAGGQTSSVFSNDTHSCFTINSSTVTTTLTNNGGINGASINNNGVITVPVNTSPGTYFLNYSICEIINPSNCDTAIAKIIVNATINANDDDFSIIPINTLTGGQTASVIENDILNGSQVNISDVTVIFVGELTISGATISNSGNINVPANTPVGVYVLTYQISQNSCLINSDIATVIIYVSPPFIPTPNLSSSIRANNAVRRIGLQSDGKIIISGSFTKYNNIDKRYIAKLNTDLTLDNSFTPAPAVAYDGGQQYFGYPNDFKIQSDDKIIVVGDGPYAYGGSIGIARLDNNGNIDPTFVTGSGVYHTDPDYSTGYVNACAIQSDGKILIGGNFDHYNGTAVSSMIRLNTDGTIDPTFTFPYSDHANFINEIVVLPNDDILVAGRIYTTNPSVQGIEVNLIKLDSDGNLFPNFQQGDAGTLPEFNPSSICVTCSKFNILKILVHPVNGQILVAGAFDIYNGSARNCIVKLNANGSQETSFNPPGSNRVIYDLDWESPANPTSNILFCGEFTTFNGATVKKMARMTSNGLLDQSFSIGSGTIDSSGGGANNNYIDALKRQSDGKVIVGGKFTSFNGITAGNITRIIGSNGQQAKSPITVYNSEPEIDTNLIFNNGNIKAYPNPCKDILNIDLTEEEFSFDNISLYNVLGMEVYSGSIISKEVNRIDVSNLPSGYYIAKISNGSANVQIKLLKN